MKIRSITKKVVYKVKRGYGPYKRGDYVYFDEVKSAPLLEEGYLKEVFEDDRLSKETSDDEEFERELNFEEEE